MRKCACGRPIIKWFTIGGKEVMACSNRCDIMAKRQNTNKHLNSRTNKYNGEQNEKQ